MAAKYPLARRPSQKAMTVKPELHGHGLATAVMTIKSIARITTVVLGEQVYHCDP